MKKKGAWMAALTLALLALTGCGQKPAADKEAASYDIPVVERSEKALASGVLTFGTNATFPPYEYYEGQEMVGIDVDIAKAIGQALGYEVKMQDMEFDSIILSVQNGKTQAGIAGITVTPDREASVAFSKPYATAVQAIIVPEGSKIQSAEDLQGKKIGTQLGTTGDILCQDDYGEKAVTSFNSGPDAVLALGSGKVDAVVIDIEPAKNYVKANAGLQVLPTPYAEESYAIALSKDQPKLLEEINQALEALEKAGVLQAIVEKYIPANGK